MDINIIDSSNFTAKARFIICPINDEDSCLYPNSPQFLKNGNIQRNSGVDIPLPKDTIFPPLSYIMVKLGIRARCFKLYWNEKSDIPNAIIKPYLIHPRSSMGKKSLILLNSSGLVDIGYTGELLALIYNLSKKEVIVRRGEALVQLVSPEMHPIEYALIANNTKDYEKIFNKTERGEGGFGSTGVSGSAGV
jgi:dUTPase